MKLLLDECVRKDVRHLFEAVEVVHVLDVGLGSLQNGELLKRADGEYAALITVDKNMPFQQSLKGKSISVLVLDLPDTELATYKRFVPDVLAAIAKLGPGAVRRSVREGESP